MPAGWSALAGLLLAISAAGLPLAAQARPQGRSPAQAAPYYPGPGDDWERRSPGQVGMDPRLLDDAVAFAKANESRNPRDLALEHEVLFGREPHSEAIGPFKARGDMTGIILRHGYIVAEWGEPTRVDMTFSMTKSFLSTTVGLAYDRGLIRDLNDRVATYVPTDEFASEHNRRITWDHLLRQTSDWEGTLWGKPDWADRPPNDVPLMEYVNRKHNAPGTSYKYNDVRVNVLAFAALQVWRRPLPQVLREHVMDPIGASNTWRWHGYDNSWVLLDGQMMQSVSGGGHWGGGMFISARDQARFGLLTLRRGRWKDRQILSEAWVKMALTPTPVQPTYGFMNWFLNTERRQWPSAPASTFCHLGSGTNLACQLPEYDLVIVARWIERGAMDEFLKRVVASVRDAAEDGKGGKGR
ncbi:MAG: serine hydrolase [Gemmatimonadetes bacterium]|nr:serine hydrolase [Gemmatimonadota bacterium]MBI2401966.1 serine hydrolase [Gemmatimonadota bacterium]MBI3082665.1 serine hydrolase [Gemmatimonadota bacterium]